MEKLNLAATGRWLSLVCASFGMLLSMPRSASAQSALTWARVELTRNQVQLFTNGQSRRAQVSDVLGVGDALSTARRARAELRFNDGSLARIGESAVFQFTPDTRNFRLSNGTVLLLIPPGQGRTTIQTPNAVTGIRGSALFVRFVPETDTTIIGALTNNSEGPMMAFNQDGSQQQPLYAGEMAVLRGDGTLERFVFELETFYETSDLVVGLQLDNLDVDTGDAAIDAVRQEIRDALEQQDRFEDGDVIENPSFLSSARKNPVASTTAIPDFSVSPAAAFLQRNGIGEGFESVVSATVNQPAADQAPPSRPSNPQPPVAQPPAPPAAPPTKPTEPIAGPPLTPPSGEPTPGEIPNQPIEKPPTPIIPEANIDSVETLVPTEPIVPESAPAPVVDTPVISNAPEPPTDVIELPIAKPTIPIVPVTPDVPPAEAAVPPETVIPNSDNLGELNLIDLEPETAVQVERLPDAVIGPETPVETPPETPVETPPETPVETPPETPVETPPETPVETPPETPLG